MHSRTWLTVLAVLPLVGCLETDLTIRTDGSVAGTITWLAAADLPEAAAKTLLTNEGVTIKKLELKDTEVPAAKGGGTPTKRRRVTAEVEAKSLEVLAAVPLLKALAVSAALGAPDAGKRALTVRAAAPGERLGTVPQTDNVIRLHFPGPVAETSAKATGNDVTWTVTAREFKEKPSVALSVVYAAEAAAPAGK
jgi:hypothetical protein